MLNRQQIELAKQRLTIPDLWRRLQLPGEPKRSCRSPFREDKRASFSVYDRGRRAKDHANGERFDGPQFLAKALGLSIGEALKTFVAMAGCESTCCVLDKSRSAKQTSQIKRPDLSKFRIPTWLEVRQVAFDRGLDPAAPKIAKRLGCLLVGDVCGKRSWILTDPAGWNAEARRFGRLKYPAWRELSQRKAHAIKGSCKAWPLGLGIDPVLIGKAALILVVEGAPDWLAAWDVIYSGKTWNVVPVAFLGRCIHGLSSDALELLRGKAIRFIPHLDPDGGALEQVSLISDQLRRVGCQTSSFDLNGLPAVAGRPINDLNDAIRANGRVRLAESLFKN